MTSLPLLLLSLALLLGNQVHFSHAFQQPPASLKLATASIHHYKTRLYSISNSNNDDNDDNEEEEEEGDTANNIFAALPPIGASSFWDRQEEDSLDMNNTNVNLSSNNIVVSRKFHLSYTCKHKDCNTRNTHSITRLGYNNGVVIAVCKCCKSKHLIADNLGWSNYLVSGFDYDGGERNIEAYVKNRQEESGDDDVGSLRVDRGVFDLESLWHEEKENSEAVVVDDEDWN
mmetsp:Transcript_6518/g.9587  ORF Transcript_6518/g.9587 Transcript_6518/m.9587 type:complete len:230 (-) Transcript_6518:603-1292(-)